MKGTASVISVLAATFLLLAFDSARSDEDTPAKRYSTGRLWNVNQRDSLVAHHWIWWDKSFRDTADALDDTLTAPDEMPELVKHARLEYPEGATKRQTEANVYVRVFIDQKGKVRIAFIRMDSGLEGCGFEETALDGARRNKWDPAYKHDEPMAMWVTYKERFRLMTTDYGDPISKLDKWDWTIIEETPDTLTSFAPDSLTRGLPTPDEFVEVESQPEILKMPQPVYPVGAQQLGMQALVWVKVLIDSRGKVVEAAIYQPSDRQGYGFEEAALLAVISGRWKPAMLGGQPIACWAAFRVIFSLNR